MNRSKASPLSFVFSRADRLSKNSSQLEEDRIRSLGFIQFKRLNSLRYEVLIDLMIVAKGTKHKDNNKNVLLLKDMNSKNDQEVSLGCTGCREVHLKRFSVCPSSQLNWS